MVNHKWNARPAVDGNRAAICKRLCNNYAVGMGKVKSLTGQQVRVGTRNNKAMAWMVIDSHDPEVLIPEVEHMSYGIKGFKPSDYKKSEVVGLFFCSSCLKIRNTKYRS